MRDSAVQAAEAKAWEWRCAAKSAESARKALEAELARRDAALEDARRQLSASDAARRDSVEAVAAIAAAGRNAELEAAARRATAGGGVSGGGPFSPRTRSIAASSPRSSAGGASAFGSSAPRRSASFLGGGANEERGFVPGSPSASPARASARNSLRSPASSRGGTPRSSSSGAFAFASLPEEPTGVVYPSGSAKDALFANDSVGGGSNTARRAFRSPGREGSALRPSSERISTPFARAKPEALVAAAADAKAEAERLRAETKRLRTERDETERELIQVRARVKGDIESAERDATRRADRETARLRDALADADERLRRADAEIRASQRNARDARQKVAAEIEREALEARREVARLEREKAQLERRWELHESASDAANRSGSRRRDREVEASRDRAKRAEEDRERLRARLETVEDERFELRRALEAHVGALVEAKVDNAEFQGCILELRKELGRCKVKYQRAAARSTKLEAMYHTLKDRSVERRAAIGKSPENDAKKNASPYMADGRTLRPGPGPVVREPRTRSVERIDY